MSKSRTPLVLGLAAAGGVGYYLYSAGGNPKAAENKFESDVHKASADVKSCLPSSSSATNAEKDLQGYGAKLGQKVDNAASEVEKQASAARSKGEAYVKDAKAGALEAVDKFDKKVEEGSAKAKSGISGWFGGGSSK